MAAAAEGEGTHLGVIERREHNHGLSAGGARVIVDDKRRATLVRLRVLGHRGTLHAREHAVVRERCECV